MPHVQLCRNIYANEKYTIKYQCSGDFILRTTIIEGKDLTLQGYFCSNKTMLLNKIKFTGFESPNKENNLQENK